MVETGIVQLAGQRGEVFPAVARWGSRSTNGHTPKHSYNCFNSSTSKRVMLDEESPADMGGGEGTGAEAGRQWGMVSLGVRTGSVPYGALLSGPWQGVAHSIFTPNLHIILLSLTTHEERQAHNKPCKTYRLRIFWGNKRKLSVIPSVLFLVGTLRTALKRLALM